MRGKTPGATGFTRAPVSDFLRIMNFWTNTILSHLCRKVRCECAREGGARGDADQAGWSVRCASTHPSGLAFAISKSSDVGMSILWEPGISTYSNDDTSMVYGHTSFTFAQTGNILTASDAKV